jgi:predicted DNA-binding transcriptional regulator YafY
MSKTIFSIILGEEMKAETIKLRFDSSQAKYIRALPLHHSQKEIEINAEFVVFEYRIKPTFDFIQEILLHGDMVEVLTPVSLRKEIRKIVEKMNELYTIK